MVTDRQKQQIIDNAPALRAGLVKLKYMLVWTGPQLHCTSLHCTALHCTALHCTALHTCGGPRTRVQRPDPGTVVDRSAWEEEGWEAWEEEDWEGWNGCASCNTSNTHFPRSAREPSLNPAARGFKGGADRPRSTAAPHRASGALPLGRAPRTKSTQWQKVFKQHSSF
jgi:hypothetical protein